MSLGGLTDEQARLFALHRYKSFYETKKNELEELVSLAAQLCNVPIAAITLVGDQQLHVIAGYGTDVDQMPRLESFCSNAISHSAFTLIPDTKENYLYGNLPVVKDAPAVRFYAASKLLSPEGFILGTLCVLDIKPSELSRQQIAGLNALSRQINQLIELEYTNSVLHLRVEEIQKQQFEIETTKSVLRTILDSSGAHHILVNRKFNIQAFNKGVAGYYKAFTGRDMHVGSSIFDFIPSYYKNKFEVIFHAAFAGKEMKMERLLELEPGVPIWWDIRIGPARSISGEIMGVSIHSININTQKNYYEQIRLQNEHLRKIAFIQAHEVRGPLASILGLINLIRTEQAPAGSEYFDLLEQASAQLDQRINEIVQLSNQAEV